jgi:diguanylate cyclase (GGDEF)-like protein
MNDNTLSECTWRFDSGKTTSAEPGEASFSGLDTPGGSALSRWRFAACKDLAVRWVQERARRFLNLPAVSNDETIIHELARVLEHVEDCDWIERTLLDRVSEITKASSAEWIGDEDEAGNVIGRGPASIEKRAAASSSAAVISSRIVAGEKSVELSVGSGGKSKRHLRLRFATENPHPVSPTTVMRVETLCAVATLALQRLKSGEFRQPRSLPVGSESLGMNGVESDRVCSRVPKPMSDEHAVLPMLQDATFLNAVLPFAVGQARRHGEPLSLLCVAVDRLKGIRELLGVSQAEKAAHNVGQHIAKTLRASDFVCRIEDERIIAALPRASLRDAWQIAQNLCRTIERSSTLMPELPLLTVSIGVSEFPGCAETVYALLDSADHALTLAQNQGRNRAIAAETLSEDCSKCLAQPISA